MDFAHPSVFFLIPKELAACYLKKKDSNNVGLYKIKSPPSFSHSLIVKENY